MSSGIEINDTGFTADPGCRVKEFGCENPGYPALLASLIEQGGVLTDEVAQVDIHVRCRGLKITKCLMRCDLVTTIVTLNEDGDTVGTYLAQYGELDPDSEEE